MKNEINRNFLSPTGFQILALIREAKTGREICTTYKALTGKHLPFGTVYTVLRRYENIGLAEITTSKKDKRCKFFKTTKAGNKLVELTRAHYQDLATFVE